MKLATAAILIAIYISGAIGIGVATDEIVGVPVKQREMWQFLAVFTWPVWFPGLLTYKTLK